MAKLPDKMIDAMDMESDTKNFKYPFSEMTKRYGKQFIELLKAMWFANEGAQTEEEFCEMNDLNKAFFDKTIKG